MNDDNENTEGFTHEDFKDITDLAIKLSETCDGIDLRIVGAALITLVSRYAVACVGPEDHRMQAMFLRDFFGFIFVNIFYDGCFGPTKF